MSIEKCAITAIARSPADVHFVHMPKKTIGGLENRPRQKTFLKKWRKYRKLTQPEAGALIGVDHSTVLRIEKGTQDYNQVFLEAAAEAYSCTVADLLMRDPESSEELWNIWAAATETQRAQIISIVKALVKSTSPTKSED